MVGNRSGLPVERSGGGLGRCFSGSDGPLRDVPYVMKSLACAAQLGWPCVDTTEGLHAPEGLGDEEAMTMMKRSYQQILQVAEAHRVIVNVEPRLLGQHLHRQLGQPRREPCEPRPPPLPPGEGWPSPRRHERRRTHRS